MEEKLDISLIQADLVWEDKEANLQKFENLLSRIPTETDLVVLPEMFSTGFTMNADVHAEKMSGPSVDWLRTMAAQLSCVITGSLIIEEDGRYFNRLVWMRPDGRCSTYDKRHLFTYADEHKTYSPGKQRLIVEIQGWKILPLICYDLRFPVWSRNIENVDLLIYVANFPEKRNKAWKQLLIGRAIENLCYTVGVNRVGMDGNGISYSGDTCAVNYEGTILTHSAYFESVINLSLSYSDQQLFRSRFSFLNDQDRFQFVE